MRGIYVDARDDIDQTVLSHAVRIARYLYPKAYLSAASAVRLGPTPEGRLYLTGQRVQRTRIRAREIIQNKAPARPSVASAIVADSLGEFGVSVSAVRQRFLEAFRLRSEHAASIDAGMREALASRLIEEYGDPQAASNAVWALARENEWYREGEGAEKFLLHRPAAVAARNEAAFDLLVAWHGAPIGSLSHDGFEWRWTASKDGPTFPPVIRQTVPGKLPPFIVSLLPEGWLESVLKDHRDEDSLILLRRVLFAWLIADGDMHLKNMALLKTATKGEAVFASVRLAPVYDAWTTRVFPGLEHDRMALKLGGKDDRLRRADVTTLAPLAGLRAADANAAIDDVLQRLPTALDAISLPPALERGERAEATVARMLDLCRARVAAFDQRRSPAQSHPKIQTVRRHGRRTRKWPMCTNAVGTLQIAYMAVYITGFLGDVERADRQ